MLCNKAAPSAASDHCNVFYIQLLKFLSEHGITYRIIIASFGGRVKARGGLVGAWEQFKIFSKKGLTRHLKHGIIYLVPNSLVWLNGRAADL